MTAATASAIAERKQRVLQLVEGRREELIEVSHAIHAHPELGLEERFAHGLLADTAERAGLTVERGAHGLETAFRADAGSQGPRIAVLCEYDALAEIGHACGHNVIAAAGLGAGLALAELCEEAGGRVVILGTPGEEGLGGKITMIEHGAFDGVAAAMMVHPADVDASLLPTLACQRLEVSFRGRSAHAAVRPEEGINALDAAVLGYMGVATLRQHVGERDRVHGIFASGGGPANVVPEHTEMEWFVRSTDLESLAELRPRVLAALESGAQATGCRIEHRSGPAYAELRTSMPIVERYAANAGGLGRAPRSVEETLATVGRGSTDMGNVSQIVPAIHPLVRIAPPGVGLHTEQFEQCAASAEADEAIVVAAAAMAMTVLDLWADPSLTGGPYLDEQRRSA